MMFQSSVSKGSPRPSFESVSMHLPRPQRMGERSRDYFEFRRWEMEKKRDLDRDMGDGDGIKTEMGYTAGKMGNQARRPSNHPLSFPLFHSQTASRTRTRTRNSDSPLGVISDESMWFSKSRISYTTQFPCSSSGGVLSGG